jgi:hypothetical protein
MIQQQQMASGQIMPPPPGGYKGVGMPPQTGGMQVGDTTNPVAMPPPAPGQGGGPTSPFAPVQGVQPPMPPEMAGDTQYARARPADYQSVQGFADQANQQARRNIDPMQEQQSRRMSQDLINKGIDPSSEQGMAMLDQQNRNFTDQDQSALFNALQFGQGIQQQAFGQSATNAQMGNQMTQAGWQRDLANRGMDVQQYGMDQQYGLGMGQLDTLRQGQDFNQMIGLEGVDFRNRAYGDQRSDYQDALTMSLMGMTPIPGVIGYDPSGLAGTQIGASQGGGLLGQI